jgi:hypothetical protein
MHELHLYHTLPASFLPVQSIESSLYRNQVRDETLLPHRF